MEEGRKGSTLATVLTWVVIGLVAYVALKLIISLAGIALVLLVTIAPIVIVGWLVIKAAQWLSRTEGA